MNENEKSIVSDEENNHFETVGNELPEGVEYDVFSENITESRVKAEGMNRDYLKHIYKEDMEFLNKDVRMTRTGYLRDLDSVEKIYEKETKQAKKRLVLHTVIFAVALALSIYLFKQLFICWDIYRGGYASAVSGSVSKDIVAAYWMLGGVYGFFAALSLFGGIAQFIIFTMSNVKALKLAKRIREKAIRNIEGRKKECMLLGQYDASR